MRSREEVAALVEAMTKQAITDNPKAPVHQISLWVNEACQIHGIKLTAYFTVPELLLIIGDIYLQEHPRVSD